MEIYCPPDIIFFWLDSTKRYFLIQALNYMYRSRAHKSRNKTDELKAYAGTYLQPHYGNGVFGNVYLSAGQH